MFGVFAACFDLAHSACFLLIDFFGKSDNMKAADQRNRGDSREGRSRFPYSGEKEMDAVTEREPAKTGPAQSEESLPLFRRIRASVAGLKDRNLLSAYLRSFLVIIVGITLTLILFSNQYAASIHADENERNEQAVVRSANEIAASLESMAGFAYKFENNAAFTTHSFVSNRYQALQTMRMYRSVSAQIKNLGIYYSELGKFLLDLGIMDQEDYYSALDQHEEFLAAISGDLQTHFVNTTRYAGDPSGKTPGVSPELIFVIPLQTRQIPVNFAVFSITDRMLFALATSSYDYAASDILVLTDKDGAVVWSTLADAADFAAITPENLPDHVVRLHKERYFMASAELNFGLTFHRLTRFNENPSRMSRIILTFIVAILILMLVSILVFHALIRKTYRPVRSLLQAIPHGEGDKELEIIRRARFLTSADESLPYVNEDQLNSLFVIDIIQHKYVSGEEIRHIAEALKLNLTAAAYCAVCIIFEDQSPSELHAHLSGRLERLRAGLPEGFFAEDLDGTRIVGILKLSSTSAKERRFYGRRLQACFQENANVTVAFGRPRSDIHELSLSYIESRSALDYRFVVGKGSIIDATELPVGALDANYYPNSQMQDYSKALRSWDVDKLQDITREIQGYITDNHLSLYQVKCICFDMASRFLTEAKGINARAQRDLGSVCDIFSISEFDSMQELMDNITLLASKINDFMEENRNLKDSQFLHDCVEYLRENMSNSQFSLEAMAVAFGISSVYLRKQYKQLSGKTLSESLQEMRIEKAKELLTTTGYSLNAITAEIGYIDVSSFIRKFRTTTGLSPGRYRAIHTASEASPDLREPDPDNSADT